MASELIWAGRKMSKPRPENPIQREIEKYAGELLTIEKIRVGILKTKLTATVRYDEQTTFEISIYNSEFPLFGQAGYVLPTERGEHDFHAEIVCKFDRVPHTREWDLFVIHVEPSGKTGQLAQPTPLQSQSAVFVACRRDAKLQKLVQLVSCHYDVYGNPFVRIQCYAEHKATIAAEVNPMLVKGMVILWNVIERKRFTGIMGSSASAQDTAA